MYQQPAAAKKQIVQYSNDRLETTIKASVIVVVKYWLVARSGAAGIMCVAINNILALARR